MIDTYFKGQEEKNVRLLEALTKPLIAPALAGVNKVLSVFLRDCQSITRKPFYEPRAAWVRWIRLLLRSPEPRR
jgi:hypothetical protein